MISAPEKPDEAKVLHEVGEVTALCRTPAARAQTI